MDLMLRPTPGEHFGGDLVMEDGDLATDAGLYTAILISLFTDRRAEPSDELPDPTGGRRGWWGDAVDDDGDLIGSRLWLLHRRKATPETRRLFEEYTREALAWLITDGVAEKLEVQAWWKSMGLLVVDVLITRPGGGRHKFAYTWEAQAEKMEILANAL